MDILFYGKSRLLLTSAIFAMAVFSGCISTPVTPQRIAAEPVEKVDDAVVAQRKAAFVRAVKRTPVRGVLVYPLSWKDFPAEEVASRAASYGFNRIYFVVSSEQEINCRLEDLMESAVKKGITPYIVLRQRDYFNRHRGNGFVRLFKNRYPDLLSVSEKAADYVEDCKAGGFVILIEPHRFTSVEQRRGGIDSCFVWSDINFGIGLDNDVLMKKSFSEVSRAAKSGVPFVPAIADFYHELAAEGKISIGKINETAKLASGTPEVLLVSTGTKPSAVAENIKNEFSSANCKITLVFIVGDHLSEDSRRFRRRNFTDFVRGIGHGTGQLASQKAYNGFVTGPLRALEYMCREKE